MTFQVNLPARHGWTHLQLDAGEVWFKGYLVAADRFLTGADAAAHLSDLSAEPGNLNRVLNDLDGLYAAVVARGGGCIAAVDRIASIPLLLDERDGGLVLFDGAASLDGNLPPADDTDGMLAVALSAYTIGRNTLYRGISRLIAGEYAVVDAQGGVARNRYYQYRAWEVAAASASDPSAGVEVLLRRLFERLARDLDGRPVAIPLSAGLDSRLIAAGLKEVGHTAVKCFAYGRPGNHEARISKAVADRLGIPWTFVPYSAAQQRSTLNSEDHRAYRHFADSLTAVPFEQDYHAVRHLLEAGWIGREDLLVNGQSGDFNTGNHIPPALGPEPTAAFVADSDPWRPALDALLAKHYDLWRSLKTPVAIDRIRALLADGLRAGGAPDDPGEKGYALFEYSEYENRQSKYTVGGQRVYEHLGLEWRLPLWEAPFVDHWRTAPLDAKYRQRLYRQTLERMDWGGVWTDIGKPDASVPAWVRPPRFAAKVMCAPFGRQAWRAVDRRFFAYWVDVLANYAPERYWQVAFDGRGFRNAISWFALRYLDRHGVGLDAAARGAP